MPLDRTAVLNAAPPGAARARHHASAGVAGRRGRHRRPTQPTLGRGNYDYSQNLRARRSRSSAATGYQSAGNSINQAAALEQTEELLNPVSRSSTTPRGRCRRGRGGAQRHRIT